MGNGEYVEGNSAFIFVQLQGSGQVGGIQGLSYVFAAAGIRERHHNR